MTDPNADRQAESRRILAEVERDSGSLLSSQAKRAAEFFAAADSADDPAEKWGKRVGRLLAIGVGAACLLYLYFAYVAAS